MVISSTLPESISAGEEGARVKKRELKEVLNESKGREPKGQHDPHAILFLVTRKLFLGSTLTFEMVVVMVYTWFDSYLKKNPKTRSNNMSKRVRVKRNAWL